MLERRPSIQVLASLRLFDGIDAAGLNLIAGGMRLRTHRTGEVVVHQGDPGEVLHVVTSGSVRLLLLSPNGDDAILATLHAPAFLGELALLDRGVQATTAVALEATDTLIVPRATFEELMGERAAAREVVLAALAGEVRRLTARVEALHFLDVPGRVAEVLLGLAEDHGRRLEASADTPSGALRIDGRLTQGDLAGMVDSSRQSVNQALAELGGEGIIRFERDGIVILAPDRLARRARP